MAFTTREGLRLHWRSDGAHDKPAILLLNSIGTDLGLWDRTVPHLTPQFRVLRMDTRGHGASDAPATDYAMEDLARDALAVLDAAGLVSATICGISLGGMIAMQLAQIAPERVDALVLACTSAQMDRAAWETRYATVKSQGLGAIVDMAMQRFFGERWTRNHPDEVQTWRDVLLSLDANGYAGCCAAIRDMTIFEGLGAIRAPTLVIAGDRDVSTPFEGHGDRIAAAIPGAQVAHLPTAHLACVEAPLDFAGVVRGFRTPPPTSAEGQSAADALFEAGLLNRRAVLGDAWVDKSLAARTPLNSDYQAMITRSAWNEIWGRPGLDHRTRRLIVLVITAALGRWEEFRLHVRAGVERDGFTLGEMKEALMQSGVYAGVPAANTAFAEAADVLAEIQ